MQPDAQGDEQGQALGLGQALDRVGPLQLGDGGRARAEEDLGRLRAPGQPAVVVHEGDEAEGQATGEGRPVPAEPQPRAVVLLGVGERRLDGLEGAREHVPQQEHEDADCEGVEEGPEAPRRVAQATDRQSHVDREPGNRSQPDDLRTRHHVLLP